MVNVNTHIHTPWSFSAFESIPQALDMAVAEDVRVVGINDFYSTDGYGEWAGGCRSQRLFPLFGIEMIGLDEAAQREGVRVNDPGNPGRTYLSGKGLAFPVAIPEPYRTRLAEVRRESEAQVGAMCEKLNRLLEERGEGVTLDFERIKCNLTRGQVRERHLAKAFRMATLGNTPDDAAAENEIRACLLKAGGAAFVAESPDAFLPVDDIAAIIRAAGGIPTYPFLGDDAKGGFTDFERDLESAAAALTAKGVHSAEFITQRNSAGMLERYAGWLWERGFIVTMGSEHNTPAMESLRLTTRDGEELTAKLKEINYLGACVMAAHQDIYAREGRRYDPARRDEYIAHGDKLIKSTIDK